MESGEFVIDDYEISNCLRESSKAVEHCQTTKISRTLVSIKPLLNIHPRRRRVE